jgi:cadmium resistance protein CadD (predicted permease)
MLATVGLAALRPLSNLARYVIPFLLIGIGIYILLDSGTDVIVG